MADDGDNGAVGSSESLNVRPTKKSIRILLFSSNRVFSEALSRALCENGMQATFSHAPQEKVQTLQWAPADVLLIDAGCHNPEQSTKLRDLYPAGKIVLFGIDAIGPSIVNYAQAGVSGFVCLDASLSDLIAAIESAICGEFNCTPRIAGKLLEQIHSLAARERTDTRSDGLTAREREIASLMARGLSNKQIARSLSVQDNTVKNHVHSILTKLGVHRRGEVIARMQDGVATHLREKLVLPESQD